MKLTRQQAAWFSMVYSSKSITKPTDGVLSPKLRMSMPYGMAAYVTLNASLTDNGTITIECCNYYCDVMIEKVVDVLGADGASLNKILQLKSTSITTPVEEDARLHEVLSNKLAIAYSIYNTHPADHELPLEPKLGASELLPHPVPIAIQSSSTQRILDTVDLLDKLSVELKRCFVTQLCPTKSALSWSTVCLIETGSRVECIEWYDAEDITATAISYRLSSYMPIAGEDPSYHLVSTDGSLDISFNKIKSKGDLKPIYVITEIIFDIHNTPPKSPEASDINPKGQQ